MELIFMTLAKFCQIYSYILIARVLLTWFPVDWYSQPYRTIAEISDPYLNLFRFIPPLGMLDISPMVAIFALYFLRTFLYSLAIAF